MDKTVLYLMAAMALAPSCALADEPADTVTVVSDAEKVLVLSSGKSTVVEITGSDPADDFRYEVRKTDYSGISGRDSVPGWNLLFPFDGSEGENVAGDGGKRRLRRYFTFLRNMYWGWVFNYDVKDGVKNCFELGFGEVFGVNYELNRHGLSFETGIGIGLRRYLASDGGCFSVSGDRIGVVYPGDGVSVDKSRLDIISFQIPVLFRQKIGRHVALSLGGVLNFNSYARGITEVETGEVRISESLKGINQRLVTADVMAVLTVSDVGVYARWSPVPVFERRFGPQTRSFSLGFSLNM